MKKSFLVPLLVITIASLIFTGFFLFVWLNSPSFGHKNVKNTILIDSDEDFLDYKFPGTGTLEDPYLIENRVIGANERLIKKWYIGLEVINTSKYFIVRNCIFYGGIRAISINGIKENTAKIMNNSFYVILQAEIDWFKGTAGIEIINSDNVVVFNNTFMNEHGRIEVTNSNNFLFENNTISDHSLNLKNSNNAIVRANTVFANSFCYVRNSQNISLIENRIFVRELFFWARSSSNIWIENNTVDVKGDYICFLIGYCREIFIFRNNLTKPLYDNTESGICISLVYSNFTEIAYNYIMNFTSYAVGLYESSSNNTIYNNMFYNNTGYDDSISQGYDEGFGNFWFHPLLFTGNYWNDIGSNSTYIIDGPANSTDLYPLSTPPI